MSDFGSNFGSSYVGLFGFQVKSDIVSRLSFKFFHFYSVHLTSGYFGFQVGSDRVESGIRSCDVGSFRVSSHIGSGQVPSHLMSGHFEFRVMLSRIKYRIIRYRVILSFSSLDRFGPPLHLFVYMYVNYSGAHHTDEKTNDQKIVATIVLQLDC